VEGPLRGGDAKQIPPDVKLNPPVEAEISFKSDQQRSKPALTHRGKKLG
jgi:hypothetical protein